MAPQSKFSPKLTSHHAPPAAASILRPSLGENLRGSESPEPGCMPVPEGDPGEVYMEESAVSTSKAAQKEERLSAQKEERMGSPKEEGLSSAKEEHLSDRQSVVRPGSPGLAGQTTPNENHEPGKTTHRPTLRTDEHSRNVIKPHGRPTLQNKTRAHAKGEIRFPVTDVEPASPRMVLTEKRARCWQERVQANGGKAPMEDGFNDNDDEVTDWEPSLEWYADELLNVCGRTLIPASVRVLKLQARLNAGIGHLDEGQQLWHLLSEVTMLFAAADYHIHRAAKVLSRDVGALFLRRGSTCTLADDGPPAGSQPERSGLPMPPFLPKGAHVALADLHLYVARLQSSGPQLAATFRRLVQGMAGDATLDIQKLLEALPLRGCKGSFGQHSLSAGSEEKEHQGRLQTLFMAVPCIEEALDRLGTLVCLVERSQAAGGWKPTVSSQKSSATKSNIPEVGGEDEDFIMEDDGLDELDAIAEEEESQEILEKSQENLEMSKPFPPTRQISPKANARPQSASRTRGSTEPTAPPQPAYVQRPANQSPYASTSPREDDEISQAPEEACLQTDLSEKRRTTDGQKQRDAKGGQPPTAPKTKKTKKKS